MQTQKCKIGFVGHEHPLFPKIISENGIKEMEWNKETQINENEIMVCPAICLQKKKNQ